MNMASALSSVGLVVRRWCGRPAATLRCGLLGSGEGPGSGCRVAGVAVRRRVVGTGPAMRGKVGLPGGRLMFGT
ncbi:hypothetical protein GCM10010495_06910 [Kitasatospora herbaricolor]|nr:hypothetical protein GCM10010495_06910 [Kitasatospora herbaricolor]